LDEAPERFGDDRAELTLAVLSVEAEVLRPVAVELGVLALALLDVEVSMLRVRR
jgi:hypothetical protein